MNGLKMFQPIDNLKYIISQKHIFLITYRSDIHFAIILNVLSLNDHGVLGHFSHVTKEIIVLINTVISKRVETS